MIDSQVKIVTALQENLIAAILKGDWSATEQWGKNLNIATSVFCQLLNTEENMALKEKINTLVSAITERDKKISELSKQIEDLESAGVAELAEAEQVADKALNDLSLVSPSTEPAPSNPVAQGSAVFR